MKNKAVNGDKPAASQSHPLPPELMDNILQNVASEAGVDKAELRIKKAEAVTWRDGSLGCPEPGMAYSQALIEGYWVVLRAGRQEYDMRVTSSGRFSRCFNRKKPDPVRNSEL